MLLLVFADTLKSRNIRGSMSQCPKITLQIYTKQINFPRNSSVRAILGPRGTPDILSLIRNWFQWLAYWCASLNMDSRPDKHIPNWTHCRDSLWNIWTKGSQYHTRTLILALSQNDIICMVIPRQGRHHAARHQGAFGILLLRVCQTINTHAWW